MSMSPSEMIVFFEQQSTLFSNAIKGAVDSQNYFLAAINIGESFKASVMQGLIAWRCDISSPVKSFIEAVNQVNKGMETFNSLNAGSCTQEIPFEKVGLISYLVDLPSPTIETNDLVPDRLLDAVLGNGLRALWDETKWNAGLEKLKNNRRASLAVESYSTYKLLLQSSPSEVQSLVDRATLLFEKRSQDEFFGGGDQTDGGGPDNSTTIDYRLSAVMKRIGYTGESIHLWHWN